MPRAAPIVLSYGFRPFFALAATHGVLAPALWLAALHGWSWPGAPSNALHWHTHEMLVGFLGAAMAGFLLTAVPSFTGRRAVRGAPLAWLACAWVAGRLGSAFAGPALWLLPAADLAFAGGLLVLVARDIVATGNRRNFILVAIVACWAAMAIAHGLRLGGSETVLVHLALLLVTVVGGRITPAFTASWLRGRGDGPPPATTLALDITAVVSVLAAGAADLALRDGLWAGGVFALAALVHASRLVRWRGVATVSEPLLWSLHLGYAWLPVGYALLALAAVDVGGLSRGAALHALTIGVVGSMVLAVMSRVVLGHTGRPLRARPLMGFAYALVSFAALARVAAALAPQHFVALLGVSACAWVIAYALFAWQHGPMLFRPRADGLKG